MHRRGWLLMCMCLCAWERINNKEKERDLDIRSVFWLMLFVLGIRWEHLTYLGSGMYPETCFTLLHLSVPHIKCLCECELLGRVSHVVGSEDTMAINCVWNHYFLTMIDAPDLCIFIFSFTGSLSWLFAECGVVCCPVTGEVRYRNHKPASCYVCFRSQC